MESEYLAFPESGTSRLARHVLQRALVPAGLTTPPLWSSTDLHHVRTPKSLRRVFARYNIMSFANHVSPHDWAPWCALPNFWGDIYPEVVLSDHFWFSSLSEPMALFWCHVAIRGHFSYSRRKGPVPSLEDSTTARLALSLPLPAIPVDDIAWFLLLFRSVQSHLHTVGLPHILIPQILAAYIRRVVNTMVDPLSPPISLSELMDLKAIE
jgi:hypothetical protein